MLFDNPFSRNFRDNNGWQRALRWLPAWRQSTSRLEIERQKTYADFLFGFFLLKNWELDPVQTGSPWRGAAAGGSRSPCVPSMAPQIHGWDPDIATGCPYGQTPATWRSHKKNC